MRKSAARAYNTLIFWARTSLTIMNSSDEELRQHNWGLQYCDRQAYYDIKAIHALRSDELATQRWPDLHTALANVGSRSMQLGEVAPCSCMTEQLSQEMPIIDPGPFQCTLAGSSSASKYEWDILSKLWRVSRFLISPCALWLDIYE